MRCAILRLCTFQRVIFQQSTYFVRATRPCRGRPVLSYGKLDLTSSTSPFALSRDPLNDPATSGSFLQTSPVLWYRRRTAAGSPGTRGLRPSNFPRPASAPGSRRSRHLVLAEIVHLLDLVRGPEKVTANPLAGLRVDSDGEPLGLGAGIEREPVRSTRRDGRFGRVRTRRG